jgi:hypothetical protein
MEGDTTKEKLDEWTQDNKDVNRQNHLILWGGCQEHRRRFFFKKIFFVIFLRFSW